MSGPLRDRPILFSAPMVRAILEGRKSQTRRLLKRQPKIDRNGMIQFHDAGWFAPHLVRAAMEVAGVKPPYEPGMLLWVRENWRTPVNWDSRKPSQLVTSCKEAGWERAWCPTHWEADDTKGNWADWREHGPGKLRPAIHLPREFSRLTLEVTAVKVERLQDISEEDAKAEGAEWRPLECGIGTGLGDGHRMGFYEIWESIYGPGSWEGNPFVTAVSFKTHRMNIDQFIAQRSAA